MSLIKVKCYELVKLLHDHNYKFRQRMNGPTSLKQLSLEKIFSRFFNEGRISMECFFDLDSRDYEDTCYGLIKTVGNIVEFTRDDYGEWYFGMTDTYFTPDDPYTKLTIGVGIKRTPLEAVTIEDVQKRIDGAEATYNAYLKFVKERKIKSIGITEFDEEGNCS